MRSLQPNIPIWEYGILGSLHHPDYQFLTSKDGITYEDEEKFKATHVVIALNKISLKGWRLVNTLTWIDKSGNCFAYFFERLKPDDTL